MQQLVVEITPAVILQNWSLTAGCYSNNQLLQTRFCSLQPAVISYQHLIVANNISFMNSKLDQS